MLDQVTVRYKISQECVTPPTRVNILRAVFRDDFRKFQNIFEYLDKPEMRKCLLSGV